MEEGIGKKGWWLVAAAAVIIGLGYVFFGAGGGTQTGEAKTVKIGFIGPLSGDAAAYGEEMQRVVSYRVEEINRAAGDNGTKFEVVYEDGKCAGNDAVSAFQKLTSIDGVKFVIGGLCSSETMAIAPLAATQKILALSGASSNPQIEGIGPFTFTFSYSDNKVGEDLAREAGAFKRVAVITEQNDFNIGIREVFLKKMKDYPSAEIVANETFPKGETNFRTVLAKIKQANPDAIVLNPNIGVTAENLVKQMAEMKDWTGYKLFGQSAYLPEAVHANINGFTEGMVVIDPALSSTPQFLAVKNDIVQKKGTVDTLGNFYTASTLDLVDVLTSLIGQYGDNPEKVRDELNTGSWKGFLGDISFDGHSFVQLETSGKYVVRGGKVVFEE